jgi:hypothetical protein
MTLRIKVSPKSGSMPLEHPAIILSEPVGAIVVREAFLTRAPPGTS